MLVSILAMIALLVSKIYMMWIPVWQTNLASVDVQDPSISNYASTISVIKYFIYNNDTGDVISVGGTDAVQGETAYTDVSII